MILDTKVIKQTRNNVYKKYLVKWKGSTNEEVIWMDAQDMLKHWFSLWEIISRGLEVNAPWEYGAQEPSTSSI